MAGGSKDLRYNVAVDASDASASLKKLGTDVKRTAKDIEGSFDDSASAGDKFKATIDELSGKLKTEFSAAAGAADKLGNALKEAGSKMDVADAIADLTRMGYTFDDITADADKFATSLKQLDDVKMAGVKELDSVAPGLATKLDSVEKSADSSKSVLANMVGNSAQDLSGLTGIAGSAGVAIGQMGEYMADARAEGENFGSIAKNFAGIAGPMAAISIGISFVTSALEQVKARQEAIAKTSGEVADEIVSNFDKIEKASDIGLDDTADIVDKLGLAFVKTQDDAGGVIDALLKIGASAKNTGDILNQLQTQAGRREFFSGFIENGGRMVGVTHELAGVLADAIERGHGFEEVMAHAMTNGGDEAKAFILANEDMVRSLETLDEAGQRVDVDKVISETRDELLKAKGGAEALAAAMAELGPNAEPIALVNRALELFQEHVKRAAADTKRFEDSADAFEEWANKAADAIEAASKFRQAMSGTDWGAASLDGAVAGMTRFTDAHFGLVNIAADSEAAFDALSASVKENGKTFDVATEKGRANQEALEGVANTLDTKFAAAYADAGGNMDTFKANAEGIARDTLARLQKELHLSNDQTAALGAQLGLLPEDIETRYKLAGDEEARVKIGLLQGAIDALPKDVQAKVTQQIIVGDYQGALATVQNYYARNPANLATEAMTPPNLAAVGAAAGAYFGRNPVPIQTRIITGDPFKDKGGMVDEHGGFAGELGPEFVTLPDGRTFLVSGTTPVPPGTNVTSRVRTNQILRSRARSGSRSGAAPVGFDVRTREAERQIATLLRPRTMRIAVQATPASALVRVNGGG